MMYIKNLTAAVFRYFEEICAIPRGSGNMEQISRYCLEFAKENGLKAVCDGAKNVVIYKPAAKGYETAEPIILQGHLDMVCQKTEDSATDPEKDGVKPYAEDGFIKAKGTTLGADNGIAVAMIMAVLSSKELFHPPIEAVFTTDEEIGMIGAEKLDCSLLKGRRMINLDSEEAEILTVSCAGGSDFKAVLPTEKTEVKGTKVLLEINGLKGGHSGTDIDKGRINANILAARILNRLKKTAEFNIIGINGGTKGNAIPFCCKAELVTGDAETLIKTAEKYISVITEEICGREEDCDICLKTGETGVFKALDGNSGNRLLGILLTTPNGVIDMSAEIDGLTETSLNLGILSTEDCGAVMQYALRSNKSSALTFLEDRMTAFAELNGCDSQISCRYEPWEFKKNSPLQKLYADVYCKTLGHKPIISAIHAGLECAVFAKKIEGLDCISMGPDMSGVHTVNERLSVSSTEEIFGLLCEVLERLG